MDIIKNSCTDLNSFFLPNKHILVPFSSEFFNVSVTLTLRHLLALSDISLSQGGVGPVKVVITKLYHPAHIHSHCLIYWIKVISHLFQEGDSG